MHDKHRQLPCGGKSRKDEGHDPVPVRVKVIEPGVQARWCEPCNKYRYFTLEATNQITEGGLKVLRLRWLTDQESVAYESLSDGPTIEGVI